MRSWGERVDQSRSFQFYCYNFGAFSPCENPLHPNISMYILHSGAPIIIQSSSNPSSRKNLDVRPYDRATARPYKVLLLTCVVNCTAGTPTPRLCSVVQWSVHWAPSRTRVLVLAGARRCALETWGKKNARLGEIYILLFSINVFRFWRGELV